MEYNDICDILDEVEIILTNNENIISKELYLDFCNMSIEVKEQLLEDK